MSEHNVEVVRAALSHFLATGEPHFALLSEDVVTADHDVMDAGEYLGHSGQARWLEDWGAAWSEFHIEQPHEYIDAGDDVVAVFHLTATGRASGVTVEREDALVCRVERGLIARLDYYNNRAEALAQIGLDG